jgi:hypothetical protein
MAHLITLLKGQKTQSPVAAEENWMVTDVLLCKQELAFGFLAISLARL